MAKTHRAGIISLGCSKNMVDTEYMMGGLAAKGWSFTPLTEEADLLLVNTCAFLDSSMEESFEAIEKALEWKGSRRGAAVVVAGCLVNRCGADLEKKFPDVDLFLRPGQIPRLSRWLELPSPRPPRFRGGVPSYLPRPGEERVLTSGFWAYLKISDGCDNRCGYCLIPSIRGRYRSRSGRSLVREADGLLAAGVREINLIGQDLTRWGHDRGAADLPGLLRRLAAREGDYRLRLLYLHPARVDSRLIRTVAETEKIFPYLDIPIQHASDRVLKGMKRRYGRRRLERLYGDLRRALPDVALRTTVMVGFPGEGKREFGELRRFLRDFPFENLGAFVFSPQEGTPAAALPGRVSPEAAEERYHEIMELQQGHSARLWSARRGRETEALTLRPLEGEGERWLGRTAWQAPEVDGFVTFSGPSQEGALERIVITGSGPYDLEGRITER